MPTNNVFVLEVSLKLVSRFYKNDLLKVLNYPRIETGLLFAEPLLLIIIEFQLHGSTTDYYID